MAGQPDLFIPNKTQAHVKQPEYGNDMREIELWAKRLVVGGSSGGGAPGIIQMDAGPDDSYPYQIFLAPSGGSPAHRSWTPLFNSPLNGPNNDGTFAKYRMAMSWYTAIQAGLSICFLPQIVAPAFTGTDLFLRITLGAFDSTGTNLAVYDAFGINIASGATIQPPSSDYTLVTGYGTDITLTAGTGFSGNGLVAGGAVSFYFASALLEIDVPLANVFHS